MYQERANTRVSRDKSRRYQEREQNKYENREMYADVGLTCKPMPEIVNRKSSKEIRVINIKKRYEA